MRAAVAAIVAVVFGLVVVWSSRTPRLPRHIVSSSRKPAEIRRCRDCHEEISDGFATAPHRIALTPADDPVVLARFAGKKYHWPPDGPTYRFEARGRELWLESDAYPDAVRVNWIFGGGRHAQTPVSVWNNADGQSVVLQHRISWYPGAGLGPTLGLKEDQPAATGIGTVGEMLNHAESMDCFGCHTTHLPQHRGRIDRDHIVRGIRCARCHPGGEQHIAAIEQDVQTMQSWSSLSPLESINRCGECHRRSDQLTKADIDPDRLVLVRFAPVGLSMSACFQNQQDARFPTAAKTRLDCLTCHDPHRPTITDPKFYVAKCLSCHGSDPGQAPVCASQPMTSQCLTCHMPTLPVQQHLAFTDHWIRIRRKKPRSTRSAP